MKKTFILSDYQKFQRLDTSEEVELVDVSSTTVVSWFELEFTLFKLPFLWLLFAIEKLIKEPRRIVMKFVTNEVGFVELLYALRIVRTSYTE